MNENTQKYFYKKLSLHDHQLSTSEDVQWFLTWMGTRKWNWKQSGSENSLVLSLLLGSKLSHLQSNDEIEITHYVDLIGLNKRESLEGLKSRVRLKKT